MASSNHPESNIELVRKAYTTFWNNEFDAFFALFEDEFEWVVSDGFPYGGQYRGREEVMANVFSEIQADWETFTHDLDRLIDGGDTIVAIGRYEATHGTTGTEVIAPMVHVFDIEAGKIQGSNRSPTQRSSKQPFHRRSERWVSDYQPHLH